MFTSLAARGKTSVVHLRWGEALWFFGFKLHLVVNEQGELLKLQFTPGNTDDRKPVVRLLRSLLGKVFADRGYVSKSLAQHLPKSAVLSSLPSHGARWKNALIRLNDKLLERKRAMSESVIDPLKNIS